MTEQIYGFCECGCGEPIPPLTSQGKPRRFIHGHNRRDEGPGFDSYVARGSGSECWPWTGYTDPNGYGRFGRAALAHREAWRRANGSIPDGLCVLHRCDNPPCCNPAHLFLGTVADNNRDMIQKGRHHVGNKLTSEQVTEIRQRLAAGETQRAIAEDFSVTQSSISRIRTGAAWV